MWKIADENYLCHYGVPGMRRGVRKERYKSSRVGADPHAYPSSKLTNEPQAAQMQRSSRPVLGNKLTNEPQAAQRRRNITAEEIKKRLAANNRYKAITQMRKR